MLKPYIIISLAPAIILWVLFHYRKTISSKFVRIVFGPITLSVAGIAGYAVITKLGSEFKSYSIQGAISTAQSFQDWHGILAENGASGYSLGYMDGSTLNIISKIPFAINVTLFRPYLWETRNPVMLISAVESTVLMIIAIRLLWQIGIVNFFRYIFNSPTILFCMFYSLFFSFCVGFTAYNFGALVRYKVPCVPFFVAGLSMLFYETKEFRLNKKKKIKNAQDQFKKIGERVSGAT